MINILFFLLLAALHASALPLDHDNDYGFKGQDRLVIYSIDGRQSASRRIDQAELPVYRKSITIVNSHDNTWKVKPGSLLSDSHSGSFLDLEDKNNLVNEAENLWDSYLPRTDHGESESLNSRTALAEHHHHKHKKNSSTPLVIWHGVGDSYDSLAMTSLAKYIAEKTGTYVLLLYCSKDHDRTGGLFGNLNKMVDAACEVVSKDANLTDGFNAMGFSQGGLLLRALVERCDNLKTQKLITWGSPHMGIRNIPGCRETNRVCTIMEALISKLGIYSNFVQSRITVAQYFRDVRRYEEYLESSTFLADINNERDINSTYKDNLLKLKKLVLLQFRDENIVSPSWSSWFDDYDAKGRFIPLCNSTIFVRDLIGLKQLDERGAIVRRYVQGRHMQVLKPDLDQVIDEYLSDSIEKDSAITDAPICVPSFESEQTSVRSSIPPKTHTLIPERADAAAEKIRTSTNFDPEADLSTAIRRSKKWLRQADRTQASKWKHFRGDRKPLSVVFVQYTPGDIFGLVCAFASIMPQLIMVFYTSLIISRREYSTGYMLGGQLLCEIFNNVLKHVVRQPRPQTLLGDGHGWPSSHAQFAGYLAIYYTIVQLERKYTYHSRLEQLKIPVVFTASALIASSRVYLQYHTVSQTLAGYTIGAVFAVLWYILGLILSATGFKNMLLSHPLLEIFRIKDTRSDHDYLLKEWSEWKNMKQRDGKAAYD